MGAARRGRKVLVEPVVTACSVSWPGVLTAVDVVLPRELDLPGDFILALRSLKITSRFPLDEVTITLWNLLEPFSLLITDFCHDSSLA